MAKKTLSALEHQMLSKVDRIRELTRQADERKRAEHCLWCEEILPEGAHWRMRYCSETCKAKKDDLWSRSRSVRIQMGTWPGGHANYFHLQEEGQQALEFLAAICGSKTEAATRGIAILYSPCSPEARMLLGFGRRSIGPKLDDAIRECLDILGALMPWALREVATLFTPKEWWYMVDCQWMAPHEDAGTETASILTRAVQKAHHAKLSLNWWPQEEATEAVAALVKKLSSIGRVRFGVLLGFAVMTTLREFWDRIRDTGTRPPLDHQWWMPDYWERQDERVNRVVEEKLEDRVCASDEHGGSGGSGEVSTEG